MSSTFPRGYYGKQITKISTTSATAVVENAENASTGRRPTRTVVQVNIANEDASNSCFYVLEIYDGTTSNRYRRETIAANGNEQINFVGLALTQGEELRITAENANDLVVTATFIEDLGGGAGAGS